MNGSTKISFCTVVCWAISALVGGLAGSALVILMGWTLLQATFAGCIVLLICGVITAWFICKEQTAHHPVSQPAANSPSPSTMTTDDAQESNNGTVQFTPPSPEAENQIKVHIKSSQLPGTEELANRKGEWKYQP